MHNKTHSTKPKEIKRDWHLIDLKDQTLGRAATKIAQLLMGKNKPYFTSHLDCGDYVVAINASKVHVTGKKRTDKLYRHHTGFPGGFRETTFEKLLEKDPNRIIAFAVKGMLPKNKLQDPRLRRLKIFSEENHPYGQQLQVQQEKEEK